MAVHWKPANGFKAETTFDRGVIEAVSLRLKVETQPTKRDKRLVSKGNKRVK